MAQDSGMVQRGLLLLGLMLIVVAMLAFMQFRMFATPPPDVSAKIKDRKVSADGWEVRYNAVVALARRGSDKLPCDVLAEMLDEEQQLRNYLAKTPEDIEFVDEQAARRTVVNAMKALTEWYAHPDAVKALTKNEPAKLQMVHTAIDKLLTSENAVLRTDAEAVKALYAR